MKVTFITYVYISRTNGRLPLFEECLASVRDQGYDDYEHVVIDDGSDLDLTPVVAGYPKTRLIRKPGTGIVSSSYTFNLGQQVATGDLCILLPSDDLSVPGGVAALVKSLKEQPEANCAIGKAVYENPEKGDLVWTPDPDKIETGIYERNHINGCAIMWRRTPEVLAKLSPNYVGFCADYDLFGLVAISAPVAYVDETIVRYRWAEDSTRNKTRARSIISSRKEDALFYQYSKLARLEFVRARLKRDLTRDIHGMETRKVEADFDIPGRVHAKLVILAGARKWKEARALLVETVREYQAVEAQVSAAVLAGQACQVSSLTVPSIVLMQTFKDSGVFDIIWEGDGDDSLFDLCPLPSFRHILRSDGTRRNDFEVFLGLPA